MGYKAHYLWVMGTLQGCNVFNFMTGSSCGQRELVWGLSQKSKRLRDGKQSSRVPISGA
jgi:hypothetical protein